MVPGLAGAARAIRVPCSRVVGGESSRLLCQSASLGSGCAPPAHVASGPLVVAVWCELVLSGGPPAAGWGSLGGDGVHCRPGLVCRVAVGPTYPGQMLGLGSDGAGVAGPGPAGGARCRVFESELCLSPPSPGYLVRGRGRGTWCEEKRPRAHRPQVPKPPRCSPGAANRVLICSINSFNLLISSI